MRAVRWLSCIFCSESFAVLLLESVVLLESMDSGEDTLENSDVTQEMEAKERTDRLMSMAEYREEIYDYLRKSEVFMSL